MKFFGYIKEETEWNKGKLINSVMDFLQENPNPNDDQVHKFAEENGYDPHKLESVFYILATAATRLLREGYSGEEGFTEKDADHKQLKMGIKVELEHSTSEVIAKKIALDHLTEIPDYYTRLHKMENEAKSVTEARKVKPSFEEWLNDKRNLRKIKKKFESYYDDYARDAGEEMLDDPQYYGHEDFADMDPISAYEDFAHSQGYIAEYSAAYNTIYDFHREFDYKRNDEKDEERQEKLIKKIGYRTSY